MFTAEAVRSLVDSKITLEGGEKIDWIQRVPTKVLCFNWRAKLNEISYATTLSKRGVCISSRRW